MSVRGTLSTLDSFVSLMLRLALKSVFLIPVEITQNITYSEAPNK